MGPHPAVAAVRRAVRVAITRAGPAASAVPPNAPPAPAVPPNAPPAPAIPPNASHAPPAPAIPPSAPHAPADPAASAIPPNAPHAPPESVPAMPALVLVACSGGADSLALAAATAFVAPRLGLRAGLVTVDHGLQRTSSEQAAQVAAIGYELGFDPVLTLPVTVRGGGGPEAAARAARYRALDDTAAALGALVLLGHTLDDQAETVLLGLGRGSGPRSIAGMRPADGHYLRPLLDIRRATTVAACSALGLEPWDDPHNHDPAFQRVRLRREVLPLLEDVLHGGVAEALARTAALLRDDLDALDEIWAIASGTGVSSDTADRDHRGLDVAALKQLPRSLRTRTLRAWARGHGAGPLTAAHTASLDALVTDWHGQGPVDLPRGRVARASGKLLMHRPSRDPQE